MQRIQQSGDIFSKRFTPATLLLIDRREDPVTPLLSPWTYTAMMHELFGVNNFKVQRDRAKPPEVFSPIYDEFYRDNMDTNMGDLCSKIQDLARKYQREKIVRPRATSTAGAGLEDGPEDSLDSLEEMLKFVEKYPEFRRFAGNVAKHFEMIDGFTRLIEGRSLYDVSEVEQEIAANQDHQNAIRMVETILANPNIQPTDKLRLVMIYELRYQNDKAKRTGAFIETLHQSGCTNIEIVNDVIRFAGAQVRGVDLFQNQSLLSRTKAKLKRVFKDVPNLLSQHRPLVVQLAEDISRGRLPLEAFPILEESLTLLSGGPGPAVSSRMTATSTGGSYSVTASMPGVLIPPAGMGAPSLGAVSVAQAAEMPMRNIVVFMVGGATFEENAALSHLEGVNVVLGGTDILNSAKFISQVQEASRFFSGRF